MKKETIFSIKSAGFLVLILLFIAIFFVQKSIDSKSSYYETAFHPTCELCNLIGTDFEMYKAGRRVIGILPWSWRRTLADYYWIKVIGYYGEASKKGGPYEWLYPMISLITELDPYVGMAYYLGGIALSLDAGDMEASNKILMKGMNYDDSWELPFLISFNYWYFKDDYAEAAAYLEEALSRPGHPKYLSDLYETLKLKSMNPYVARRYIEEMLSKTNDPKQRAKLKRKLHNIMKKFQKRR